MNWRRIYSCCEPDSEDYDSDRSDDVKSDDEFIVREIEPRPPQQQQQQKLTPTPPAASSAESSQPVAAQHGRGSEANSRIPVRTTTGIGYQDHHHHYQQGSVGSEQQQQQRFPKKTEATTTSRPPRHEDLGGERQSRMDNKSDQEMMLSPATDDTRMMSLTIEDESATRTNKEEKVRGWVTSM